jgi:hypothetical protein
MTTVERPQDIPPLPKDIPSSEIEYAKLRYAEELQAWLEEWKQKVAEVTAEAALIASREDTRTARNASRIDATLAAEVAAVKSVQDAYIATSQSSLDRALTRVNVVTASISAVITIYTALLGLVFAAEPGKGQPLSLVAIVPALFLGLALFLVTIYAAMFKRSLTVGPLLPSGVGGQIAEIRLVTFMRWCFAGVLARSWALHAGIVSFGIGIATLPLPFVRLSGPQQVAILVTGMVVVGATALANWSKNRTAVSAAELGGGG